MRKPKIIESNQAGKTVWIVERSAMLFESKAEALFYADGLLASAKAIFHEAVDKHGLRQTIEMIVEICSENAKHIRAEKQDTATAAAWDNAAQVLLRASQNPVIKSPLGGTGL